jgi:hypothetical protein
MTDIKEANRIEQQFKHYVDDFEQEIDDYMANDNYSPYNATEIAIYYARLHLGAGEAHMRVNNFDDAERHFKESIYDLKNQLTSEDKEDIALINEFLGEMHKQLAEIRIIKKNYADAVRMLRESKEYFKTAIARVKEECDEEGADEDQCLKTIARINVDEITVDALISEYSQMGGKSSRRRRTTRKTRKHRK